MSFVTKLLKFFTYFKNKCIEVEIIYGLRGMNKGVCEYETN